MKSRMCSVSTRLFSQSHAPPSLIPQAAGPDPTGRDSNSSFEPSVAISLLLRGGISLQGPRGSPTAEAHLRERFEVRTGRPPRRALCAFCQRLFRNAQAVRARLQACPTYQTRAR
jgi:hypothetical protein